MGLTLRNIRMVECGAADHPCHVVASGSTSPALVCALEGLRTQDASKDYIRKQVAAVFAFFDWLFETRRSIDPRSAPATLVGGLKAYLKTLRYSAAVQKPNTWITVEAPREKMDMVNALLVGLRRGYEAMVQDGHYPHDQHPYEMSEEQLRQQRLRDKRSGRKGRCPSALCDALFRLKQRKYAPPRRTQVALLREVVRWAEEAGWPESLLVYPRLLHAGGCRPSEPSRFRVRDWYEASRCGLAIYSTDKNEPDNPAKPVRFEQQERDALAAYFDGARHDALPEMERMKVADVIRLGDAGRLGELEQPLLLAPGGGAWVLDTISRRWWRPLMRARCVDPVTGRAPIRMPTMHWLRHLFVYDHLALIEHDPDRASISRRKDLLVAYIGWSTKLVMLETYGREFEDAKVAAEMVRSMGRRTEMAKAIQTGSAHWAVPSRPDPRPTTRVSNMLRDRGERKAA